MIKILEYFIRKIKGDNFQIDREISIGYLINKIFSMIINLIRGNIKTIFIHKKSNINRAKKIIFW